MSNIKLSWTKIYLSFFTIFLLKSAYVGLIYRKNDEFLDTDYNISLMLILSIYYILSTNLVTTIPLFFKEKYRISLYTIFNVIFSIILLIDILYFRAYNMIPSVQMLNQFVNLNDLQNSVLYISQKKDIILFIDIIIIFLIYIWRKIYNRRSVLQISKMSKKLKLAIVIFFVVGIVNIYIFIGFSGVMWNPNAGFANFSPINYHIVDIYKNITKKEIITLNEDQIIAIENWYKHNKQKKQDLEENVYKGKFEDKNLIVVLIESLEMFPIQNKINNQELTPNINQLLKNSINFVNFYEQVNLGNSADADFIMNTSLYPLSDGVAFMDAYENTYHSLPKILNKYGYNSISLHADKPYYWNYQKNMNSLGFNEFYYDKHYDDSDKINMGISDKSFFLQSSEILEKEKTLFFSWLITLTGHMPFDVSDIHKKIKFPDDIIDEQVLNYLNCMNYVDEAIGEFMVELDKKNLIKNSVVVFIGDHTGIHKYSPDLIEKYYLKYPWMKNDKKVPFIIYSEGQESQTIETIGGHIDVMPTLLYLLGIDKEEYENTSMGRNLLNTNENFVIVNNGKYIGDYYNELEKNHAIEGLNISDLIIKSDYFKGAKYDTKR